MSRQNIIAKINSMRAKASDNAATEAEATSAAEMAARLLQKHDISEIELQRANAANGNTDSATVDGFQRNRSQVPPVLKDCWGGISALTETTCYQSGGTGRLNFIGMDSDVAFAMFICELIVGAADRGWKDYGKQFSGSGRSNVNFHRRGYMEGFGRRMNERLNAMARERKEARKEAESKSTGTALTIVKKDLIERKKKEMGLTLRRTTSRRSVGSNDSATAGNSAANKVNLNRPVGRNASAQAIN